MDKYLKTIINWFSKINELLIIIFVFATISGLLFNDPFKVIDTINKLLNNLNSDGMAGLISLLVIMLWYGRK